MKLGRRVESRKDGMDRIGGIESHMGGIESHKGGIGVIESHMCGIDEIESLKGGMDVEHWHAVLCCCTMQGYSGKSSKPNNVLFFGVSLLCLYLCCICICISFCLVILAIDMLCCGGAQCSLTLASHPNQTMSSKKP